MWTNQRLRNFKKKLFCNKINFTSRWRRVEGGFERRWEGGRVDSKDAGDKSVRTVKSEERGNTLIRVELVAKVEEEACRLARETAGGGQGEVRRDEEVIDVFVVNLAGDGCVVAENSALVGGGPHEAEDCSIERGVGGAQIVEGQVVFGGGEDFGQVKLGLGVVADSDNGARNELCRRE